ncbi:hypothetical protein BRADI_1g57087v3 [Brachypodium distachyon]|uniref:Uncharacterized protein n=1 Tax=Brachypodium distachyon TaxID=15368 RepID=A0A2K2DRZ3_BRADI|nr:hypothetical protein BRADI_1g57087v3 [Brachypodium distachyon]
MARRPTRRQAAPGSSPARDHGRWGAPLLRSAGSRGEPIDFVGRGGEEQLPALDPPHFLSARRFWAKGVGSRALLVAGEVYARARALLCLLIDLCFFLGIIRRIIPQDIIIFATATDINGIFSVTSPARITFHKTRCQHRHSERNWRPARKIGRERELASERKAPGDDEEAAFCLAATELKNLKLGNFGEKLEAGERDREGEGSFGVENRSSKMELGGHGDGAAGAGGGRWGYLGGSSAATAPSGSASPLSEVKGPQLVRYDAQRDELRLCPANLNRDDHQRRSGIGRPLLIIVGTSVTVAIGPHAAVSRSCSSSVSCSSASASSTVLLIHGDGAPVAVPRFVHGRTPTASPTTNQKHREGTETQLGLLRERHGETCSCSLRRLAAPWPATSGSETSRAAASRTPAASSSDTNATMHSLVLLVGSPVAAGQAAKVHDKWQRQNQAHLRQIVRAVQLKKIVRAVRDVCRELAEPSSSTASTSPAISSLPNPTLPPATRVSSPAEEAAAAASTTTTGAPPLLPRPCRCPILPSRGRPKATFLFCPTPCCRRRLGFLAPPLLAATAAGAADVAGRCRFR